MFCVRVCGIKQIFWLFVWALTITALRTLHTVHVVTRIPIQPCWLTDYYEILILFWRPDSNLPDCRKTTHQTCIRDLVLVGARKIHSPLFLNFTVVKKCQIWSQFRLQWPLAPFDFEMEQYIGNLKHCVGTTDNWPTSVNTDSDNSPNLSQVFT